MFKLYFDEYCNIGSLKILTAAKYYSVGIDVVKISDLQKSNFIPILDLPDRSSLFSSNASCKYIYSLKNDENCFETDSWLEWEASILQPSVTSFLKTSKGDNMPSFLKNNLIYLNAVLGEQKYFSAKESLGLPDIVLWCNLYPLFKSSLLTEVSELSNLQKWLTSLKTEEPLNQAFSFIAGDAKSEVLKKKLVYSCFSLSENYRFFMPVIVPGFSFYTQDSGKENQEKDDDVSEDEAAQAYDIWLKGQNIIPLPKLNTVPVLPIKDEKNILITSALPYVNNVPHLGNIIGSVLSADVFARYCRSRGYNTLYICGTDEYGTATETKAISMGVTPREICDKYNKLHTEIYQWFNISFDHFGRTTTNQQTEIAQDIFNKLYAQDLVLTDDVEQLYCQSCDRFLADRFVEGICPLCGYEDARGDQCDKCGKLINATELKQPKCKLCHTTPQLRSSKHLFLDLPKLETSVKQFLDKVTATGQWSNTAKVIANSWLREGLKPRCITRDLKWGTPVPLEGFTDKVLYVWFDAPIGYISITANYTAEWEKWWKQPHLVQLYQFMAKDNVPFHSIVFPACQLGTKDNYTMVSHLAATEYLNYEDMKFSKSRGVGVFGDDAKDTGLPSDVFRFYLLYVRPEGQDTYFCWNDLMLKINSELLNNLGNFINRALSFVSNNFGGCIPPLNPGEIEKTLIAQVNRELKQYIHCMEKTRLRDAIKYMLNISRIGNQYIQSNKPWELVKGSAVEKARAGTILGLSANVCCLLCTLMEPYMPETCETLKSQLNTQPTHHILIEHFVCLLPEGHTIGKPAPLFKKIEQDLINELKKKYAGRQSPEKEVSPAKTKKKDASKITNEIPLPNGVNSQDIQSLEESVTQQGNKVRELKTKKAPKSEIEQEVNVLLNLKKKLSLAKGENPDQLQGKVKGKKKK